MWTDAFIRYTQSMFDHRIRRRALLGLLLLLAFTVTFLLACGPEDLRPPPPSTPVPDNRHPLEKAGMVLYDGENPPDVTGDFFLDSLEIVYDDLNVRFDIVNYTYYFSEQTALNEVETAWEADGIDDTAAGVKGRIEGSGACWTNYVQMNGALESCTYAMENVFSGCMQDGGIRDWFFGFVMLHKDGEGCEVLVPVDHRRVIKEADGLASRL